MQEINTILTLNHIGTLINIILIIIGAYIIFKILQKILKRTWKKYELETTGYYIINDVIKYLIGFTALSWILEEIGIDLNGILLSVGIIGIIVGFAAKDTISNLMSGIQIVTDKKMKTGQVIEVNNTKGKITKINFRTTTLKTVDDFIVTIPNSILSNTQYTLYPPIELNKIKLKLKIPYNIDIQEFEEKLKTKILKHEEILNKKTPHIEDIILTEYGYEIIYFFWIKDYHKISQYKVQIGKESEELIRELGEHLKISQ